MSPKWIRHSISRLHSRFSSFNLPNPLLPSLQSSGKETYFLSTPLQFSLLFYLFWLKFDEITYLLRFDSRRVSSLPLRPSAVLERVLFMTTWTVHITWRTLRLDTFPWGKAFIRKGDSVTFNKLLLLMAVSRIITKVLYFKNRHTVLNFDALKAPNIFFVTFLAAFPY